jgi:hypothetical protein
MTLRGVECQYPSGAQHRFHPAKMFEDNHYLSFGVATGVGAGVDG